MVDLYCVDFAHFFPYAVPWPACFLSIQVCKSLSVTFVCFAFRMYVAKLYSKVEVTWTVHLIRDLAYSVLSWTIIFSMGYFLCLMLCPKYFRMWFKKCHVRIRVKMKFSRLKGGHSFTVGLRLLTVPNNVIFLYIHLPALPVICNSSSITKYFSMKIALNAL